MRGPLRICVAIPTFRRPGTFGPLLDALSQLTFASEPPLLDVLVVDNDPQGSAHTLVEEKRARFRGAVHYARVAQPGLCSVRNYALGFAADTYDALVMIDDDEAPPPGWLDALLRVREATQADAVIGHVVPSYPPGAPRWITSGSFFCVPPPPDGMLIEYGNTANCLMMLATVRAMGLSFDPALNQAGGEDELFFRQIVARGGRIAFAAHAVVTDFIPSSRLNPKYILQRELRKGNTLTICDQKIHGTVPVLALRAAKGIARSIFGLVSFVPRALIWGRRGAVGALCDIVRGVGMLLGLAGVRILGYKRTDVTVATTEVFLQRDPRLLPVTT
ncbi:MAG TPA: glycosyltransferase [Candidatus Acidoferrales bacterium]|nr:glycosyltransferase [Candidatus Acidoferrales bacterium]